MDDPRTAVTDGGSADFVTFVVEGELYAFPMERVKEIIRMPQVVRLPLGPPSLRGLANLRGQVLPVVGLRPCCGLPDVVDDEATRVVVVVDGAATLGFVVDRVASVASVDVARIEAAERIGGAIDAELLSGIVKPAAGSEELTKVLDVGRLVASQFALLAERSDAAAQDRAERAGLPGAVQAPEADADDDTLELVSFSVDGQEYALPIDRVQEIVQAPERVTTVPNAHARVLGVMDLRGRLLPVVSLRQVFGLEVGPLEPANRIVVVQMPGQEGAGARPVVGVVMDTVREVLRVPQGLVAALPEFMARAGRAREVEAVCRLEDGRRLVSVLSVERLFEDGELRAAVEEAVGDISDDLIDGERADGDGVDGDRDEEGAAVAVEAGTPDGEQAREQADEVLVAFRLGGEEYSVVVDAVQEIIRVPEMLIRVPKALDFVEGLVNLRGAVLPVVDLRTRLGLPRGERDDRQRIIVLIVGGVRTGFVVDSVTEVLRVGRGDLEPAPELSAEQSSLVKRVANLARSRRMLMMLDPDHLLATEQLAALGRQGQRQQALPQQREAAVTELVAG